MRFIATIYLTLIFAHVITSRSVLLPELSIRNPGAAPIARGDLVQFGLEKRRGGGGGGHGGGGGDSSSGGGSGGRSGGGGTKSGSSGSSSSGSTSSSSNVGGSSHSGSGSPRTYGDGSFYAGGASVPFAAGASTQSGIKPSFLGGAALGFFAGAWAHGAYGYPYAHPYFYHNPQNPPNQQNETLKVICLCEPYSECGCNDQSSNATYISNLLAANPPNNSVVTIARINNTEMLLINGTLANGTTAPNPSLPNSANSKQLSGYLPIVVLVVGMVWAHR